MNNKKRSEKTKAIRVKTQYRPSSLVPILMALQDMMPRLREKYRVASLSIFGSWVRGEQTEKSDLDILVEFFEPPGLITFLTLEDELSTRLGLKVDLVPKGSLKPAIKNNVLHEAIPV